MKRGGGVPRTDSDLMTAGDMGMGILWLGAAGRVVRAW
jgi:hypothetical protein